MNCSVLTCSNYKSGEKGFCEVCTQMLTHRHHYIAVECWSCQSIVHIYKRPKELIGESVLFCVSCRNCAGTTEEEKHFVTIKKKE